MTRLILSLAAGAVLVAGTAQAQAWEPRGGGQWDPRCECYGQRAGGPYGAYDPYDRTGIGPGVAGYDYYQPGRSAFRQGMLLPPSLRGYLVRDYHKAHLGRPERGHAWYHVGNEYIMAETATGAVYAIVTFP